MSGAGSMADVVPAALPDLSSIAGNTAVSRLQSAITTRKIGSILGSFCILKKQWPFIFNNILASVVFF